MAPIDSVITKKTLPITETIVPDEDIGSIQFLSNKEVLLGLIILTTLIIVLIINVIVVKKMNINADSSVKLLLTTIVIFSGLFLVAAGYDDRTIAPVFGLLGATLGYIFGKSETNKPA
ncbi:hypothetical protein [Hymenobacter daecheongensis]|uniref:hypothetical protein n=1 Tax=Hymenobacter daecheongensis TaxID=496053 RepID=UPI00116143C8|nr:hypothetical protein [Hymenobacter daecheongensis]